MRIKVKVSELIQKLEAQKAADEVMLAEEVKEYESNKALLRKARLEQMQEALTILQTRIKQKDTTGIRVDRYNAETHILIPVSDVGVAIQANPIPSTSQRYSSGSKTYTRIQQISNALQRLRLSADEVIVVTDKDTDYFSLLQT